MSTWILENIASAFDTTSGTIALYALLAFLLWFSSPGVRFATIASGCAGLCVLLPLALSMMALFSIVTTLIQMDRASTRRDYDLTMLGFECFWIGAIVGLGVATLYERVRKRPL